MTEAKLHALADAAQKARAAFWIFDEKKSTILPVAERVAVDLEARRLRLAAAKAITAYDDALDAFARGQQ